MMYYTHLAFGLLVSLLLLDFLNIENKFVFIVIVLFFSIFPDIDETKSKIGRKNKIISRIINFIFGHRGFFHSIYIPLALFGILYNINYEAAIAILAGYFSHLFADGTTKQGIRPLNPLINKRINGFLKTNSLFEKMIFLMIILVDLSILITYI